MAALKPNLPFGQLPVLEYKGTTIGQSMTIARFLANEFGMAGDTPIEKAQVDEVVDAISDFQNALVKFLVFPKKFLKISFLVLVCNTF